MTFKEELAAEFTRLYMREPPSEPEWETMEHPERCVVMAAQAAAIWNIDYRYTITAICKFTDLSRVEALVFYAMHRSREAHERLQAMVKEPWK